MATRDPDLQAYLDATCAAFGEGRFVEEAPPEVFFERPREDATRAFLAPILER